MVNVLYLCYSLLNAVWPQTRECCSLKQQSWLSQTSEMCALSEVFRDVLVS